VENTGFDRLDFEMTFDKLQQKLQDAGKRRKIDTMGENMFRMGRISETGRNAHRGPTAEHTQ
jgi:hypothetical protein